MHTTAIYNIACYINTLHCTLLKYNTLHTTAMHDNDLYGNTLLCRVVKVCADCGLINGHITFGSRQQAFIAGLPDWAHIIINNELFQKDKKRPEWIKN